VAVGLLKLPLNNGTPGPREAEAYGLYHALMAELGIQNVDIELWL